MTQGPKTPSPENKRIAHHAAQVFGGTPRVTRFGHDTEDLSLSILSCVGCPEPGITSYATIGLSDHEIDTGATTGDLRIELGGACRSDVAIFPNILSTAAFCLIRANRIWRPGSVLRDAVTEYLPATSLRHLYLTAPSIWSPGLETLQLPSKTVVWLMVVPISDGELNFLELHGDEALEDTLEREGTDVFDLSRPEVA